MSVLLPLLTHAEVVRDQITLAAPAALAGLLAHDTLAVLAEMGQLLATAAGAAGAARQAIVLLEGLAARILPMALQLLAVAVAVALAAR